MATETKMSTDAPDHEELVDQAIELAYANSEARPSLWTWSMFRLYGCLLIGYLCACTNGFDGSVMGGINAMTSYQDYFHMVSASSSTGIIFAIYNIGTACAVLFVGPVNDHWGRRAGMWTGAAIVIIGTFLTARAKDHGMFIAGRFVLGFGVCFLNVSGPVYVGEMAHPVWRGPLSGLYNCFWYIGSIVAAWVVYGTKYKAAGWRIPLYCQLIVMEKGMRIIPSLNFKWLKWNMRFPPMDQTRSSGITENSGKLEPNVTACFVLMLENAGITSESKKLLLNGINAPLCFIASISGSMLLDKAGRRPLLMGSLLGCMVFFAILTPLSKLANTDPDNPAAANSSIAFIYLFAITFSTAWTPLSPMYVVECLETSTRAKGKSLAQFITACSSAVVSYSSGPAFQHIKYYFYIAFIGWDVVELIVIYFFWPETKDRTLEELKEVFAAPNPVKKSLEPKNLQTVFNTLDMTKAHVTVTA
ncbi:hypothetical protein TCE0_018r05833 [Talaromyces pinophilus]|uniref:Major facilitator superfamily (MFS) profile domain-containing protein n=1 Tax=Talaromyces pinophilus TaxID=128442 RepID=A0A510NWL0_TALPI|nr:hypothetical protein TCE0_018r05833 [Talaromyces pinophilus]